MPYCAYRNYANTYEQSLLMSVIFGLKSVTFSFLPAIARALAVVMSLFGLSVRLSLRLSQVGVLLKRLNVGSRKQRPR